MIQHRSKLEQIKEEGRVFNSIEFTQLGEMSRRERRREIVRKIIKFTRRTLDYENIACWEIESERIELVPLFSRGYGAVVRQVGRLEPGLFNNGIVGYVAHVGYPYIARDLRKDPHYIPGISSARSSVTVPFKVGHQVFGVLNIESRQASAFDNRDIEILREFAGHVAVVLNIRRILDIGERITVGRISKTLAHEVNNPLETIFMTMSTIDAHKEALSPELLKALRTINQNLNLIKSAVTKLSEIKTVTTDEEYEIIDIEEPLAGRKALIIEDENEVRESLRSILEAEGISVDDAADGEQGVAMAGKSDYDIVITDIKMPGCSGYEVFKRIREEKPDQKMVMMTGFGYDESHSIIKSNEQGLNGVLYKPFTSELLKKVLSRVCK